MRSGLTQRTLAVVAVMLAALFAAATRVRADDIFQVTDQHGHKVYMNSGKQVSPRGKASSKTLPPKAPPAEIKAIVDTAAKKYQVDPQLVHAMIQVESDYNTNAVSRRGAMGLMQLAPATANRFGVSNPFNARQNVEGGVNYLRRLLDQFGGDISLALAGYNAGEHAVQRSGGIPEFTETRNYIRKVTSIYGDTGSSGRLPGGSRTKAPIYRYVDQYGVVHYTNGDEL